jgi:hypothetical protein
MTLKKTGAACALLLALVLARTSTSFAAEPLDNTVPWSTAIAGTNYTDVTMYTTRNIGGTSWGANNDRKITPAGDVDYFMVGCGKTTGTGLMKQVQISFTHAVGDLDMFVYSLDGQVIGTSTGVTNFETVNVAAQNKNAFFVRVYGFNNAVNPYAVIVDCQ